MRNNKFIIGLGWLFLLGLFAVTAAIISLLVGAAGIPVSQIFLILREGAGNSDYGILMQVRLPRILLGFAIGGALSLAGVLLQGMFRNPLVEPYTLGISGGAALGVTIAILCGLQTVSAILLPVTGFTGAICVIVLIYFLSLKDGRIEMHKLLLTGVMLSFILSSVMMLMMALANSNDLHGIIFWIMGSLEEPNAALIRIVTFASLGIMGLSCFFAMDLNALMLGEDEAKHLGIPVERIKIILFLMASILTGLSVSVAGVIGFVGLVVPHFVRFGVGSDHRLLLPASYLAGGGFLILCDTLARTLIMPLELPVGVMTGILGGGLFVWVLAKRKKTA